MIDLIEQVMAAIFLSHIAGWFAWQGTLADKLVTNVDMNRHETATAL